MSALLTLSRAARVVGTTRGLLQKKIRDGELTTFEGLVSADELLRVFPKARLDDDSLLDRLNQIKDAAFARRIRERILPDPEVLAARLAELGQDLADARAARERYRELTVALDGRLAEMERDAAVGARARELRVWLLREMSGILEGREARALVALDRVLGVMTAHAKMVPSGHEFFCEGSDTLLEAALRAGLPVNYGCTNGNCGLCKARLVSGDVRKVRTHDYVLTEAEKAAGYLLLCSNAAVNDVTIEALEATTVADLPRQHLTARVKSVVPVGKDHVFLTLQTPRTQRLRFFAGQSVWLALEDGESAHLSVASCPCDDRNLEFHLRRDGQSAFVNRVLALRVSEPVVVDGPAGSFVLGDETFRPLTFIAVEDGFAPIKSLIEHAIAQDTAESINLYWVAPDDSGRYLSNLCRAWVDAFDNFHFSPLAAGTDVATSIAADVPDLSRHAVFIAGPDKSVDMIKSDLAHAGLVPAHLATLGTND